MAIPIVGGLSDDDTAGGRHALGREGERLAARMLERQGWSVLDRNWRCARGELDVVASDGAQVVFCEVRTRSGTDYGEPLETVRRDKIVRVRELARLWLHERGIGGCRVRFDVFSVLWPPGANPRVKHVEGAFE